MANTNAGKGNSLKGLVKMYPGPGVTVTSKYVLVVGFSGPLIVAAPALYWPLDPEYPEDCAALVRSGVEPLLLPRVMVETVAFNSVTELAEAFPELVPKFQ